MATGGGGGDGGDAEVHADEPLGLVLLGLGHTYLSTTPPKAALSRLAGSLKDVSARRSGQEL